MVKGQPGHQSTLSPKARWRPLEEAFRAAEAVAARLQDGFCSDASSASDDPPFRMQMFSTRAPTVAQAVGFEHATPISGEDAEELDKWFASLT